MTSRERYLETLLFGRPDRIPFEPGGPRESTLQAWREQGLPEDVDWHTHVRELIGIEPPEPVTGPTVRIRHTMIPEFEEKVIEEREDSLVVQDWKGNVCEISRKFDVSYLRGARDFVTRSWIRCPVESRDDWEAMKSRYVPRDPSRVPEDIESVGARMRGRSYVAGVQLHGPFWQMREWLGFEGLCMKFLEAPEMIRDMVRFWTEYTCTLLERVMPRVDLDFLHISEDMAYKQKAMISPTMAREFLQPAYDAWNEVRRSHGCPVFDMDSDGCIDELIPVWIESGINVCDPIEVAAGNDIAELRKRFGRQMAFRGGIDKRAMARGGEALANEMARVEPVAAGGGYIPGCDHGVPADVSWPNFVEYCDLLARITGWK